MADRQVVHVQTQVQTVLGVLDGDGNVVETHPLTLQINVPSEEAFAAAAAQIAAARAQLQERQRSSGPEVE